MHRLTAQSTLDWLATDPPLAELRERFPSQWERVEALVADTVATGGTEALTPLAQRALAPANAPRGQRRARPDEIVSTEVERQMTVKLVREIYVGVSTGADGAVRFNKWNGKILQSTLFEHGLVRKPVTMKQFKRAWKLAPQRQRLMPLVRPKGIYCFYSTELIAGLVELIGDEPALEIAAGDGTLTRFLNDAGATVTATDDHSWGHAIEFPDFVAKKTASVALRSAQPGVVLCSFPPAGNRFEREVFTTRSVHTYVVITSRIESEAGNWEDY